MRGMRSHNLFPHPAAALLLVVAAVHTPATGAVTGPEHLPGQLPGLWRVSLCVSASHAWIRFEHAETGELHTIGRYVRGCGGIIDWRTGRWVWPNAPVCGVIWDMDVKYDLGLRRDGRVVRTCFVRDPIVYRGERNGYGHYVVQSNCATFARDAWCFYTGEYYRLPPVATPCALGRRARGWLF